jgi:hypothetical protein
LKERFVYKLNAWTNRITPEYNPTLKINELKDTMTPVKIA